MLEIEHRLIGFAPDMDYTTPGAIIEGSNFVPTFDGATTGSQQNIGISGAPSLASSGLAALAAECRGAASVRLLDDSRRVFAGTQTKLYEAGTTTWTDRSAGGGSYTGGAESRWRFAQFGNDTYATNKVDALQSSSGAAFAAAGTNAPKLKLIETASGFLMGFDYNDGVNDYADGWYCSPLQNPGGNWTPSIATQAANGRLLDSPGSIRAGKRLGDDIIAYKERSMYRGRYVGPPYIWSWSLIPTDGIGALNHEAVVNLGTKHIFAARDGFYEFDGSRPVLIGPQLSSWWRNTARSETYAYKMFAVHDRNKANIYFFYVPKADIDGRVGSAVVYNYQMGMWGLMTQYWVEAALEYISGAITYDSMGTLYSDWSDLPAQAYDSPFWTSGGEVPALFNSSHTLSLLNGASSGSTMRGCWFGDFRNHTALMGVRPWLKRLDIGATAPLMTHYYSDLPGEGVYTTGPGTSYVDGRFDVRKAAKWHSIHLRFYGDWTISGYTAYVKRSGGR